MDKICQSYTTVLLCLTDILSIVFYKHFRMENIRFKPHTVVGTRLRLYWERKKHAAATSHSRDPGAKVTYFLVD